jgi:amidase
MPPTLIDTFSPATEMMRQLRSREISAVELLDAHLHRIEQLDGRINSIVVRDFERARNDARVADEQRAGGIDTSLLGLPVTVKESIDLAGLPSTAGVPERRGHAAPVDALTVRRLRAAGAIVVGKTNVCTWLADYTGDNPVYGRTINPWNAARTSGGSTAGSAALAAGLIPLELGSDLGGSIRVPAAFCGLVGHKPSETLVPNSGHFPGSPLPNAAWCLSMQGPHARTAADVRLMLEVISGPDVGDDVARQFEMPAPRHEKLSDFRVAVLPPVDWLPVDRSVLEGQQRMVDRLRGIGVSVETIAPPFGELRDFHRLYRRMMSALISARWPAALREQNVADRLSRADEFFRADADGFRATAGDYLSWHGQREIYRDAYRSFFRNHDILLTPMALVPAFEHTAVPVPDRILRIDGRDALFDWMSFYPGLATLPGHPATAFPAGFSADGLPVGLQAIGPFLEDYTPLRFVELIEQTWGGFVRPSM